MDDFLAATGGEVVVQRSQLQGVAPFPTWNGTIAAAAAGGGSADGRCTVLCENGDVLVLQALSEDQTRTHGQAAISNQVKRLQVERILRSPVDNVGSFCQCWSSDGSVFATAHDRRVTFYSTEDDLCLQLSVQLRFSVTSMDIAKWWSPSGDVEGDGDEQGGTSCLLVVGTAFGAYLYRVELSASTSNQEDGEELSNAVVRSTMEPLPALASAYEGTPICFVKFSQDADTIALGTVDGRLYVRSLTSNDESPFMSAFGSQVVAKVLAAPRVTSISFSPCNRKLAVATRKGNVYVLARRTGGGGDQWQMHPPCKELSANPKPVSAGSSKSSSAGVAVAMQTFVCWWGADTDTGIASSSSSVLVVASRSANYRLEMVDVRSGKLVHSIQMIARPANSGDLAAMTTTDDHLLAGVCCVNLPNGLQKLVCHDTDANVSLVTWPLLEIASCSRLL